MTLTSPANRAVPVDWRKLAIYCSLTFLFLLIPLRISGFGNIPPDDCGRHVAFAVDHRAWGEVLVLNENILETVDSHPGWHAYLRTAHQWLGLDPEGLVVLSFTTTFAIFACTGLYASGRPVAWVTSLLAMVLLDGGMIFRVLLGRPFAISMAVLLGLLFLWQRKERLPKLAEYALTSVALGLAIVTHPSWYIWLIVPVAFVLAGRLEDGLRFGLCLLFGLLIATGLTGSYYNIVFYPLQHLFVSLGQDPIRRIQLVSEFQPGSGVTPVVMIVALVLGLRTVTGRSWRDELRRPDFCLMVLGWLAGLYVLRFWADWGTVAFVAWLSTQLEEVVHGVKDRWQRLALGALPCAALFLLVSSDTGGRYSNALTDVLMTKPKEDLRKYLPERGGILYSTDMRFFYQTYYRMPEAGFRYVLGFEPGMMRSDDWDIFRKIQFNDGSLESYEGWFKKMTNADRILITAANEPVVKGMAFEPFVGRWIGRKVKTPPKTEKAKESQAKPMAAPGAAAESAKTTNTN
jgi:hypothetical protein